jgi:hypothetical protein
VVRGNFFDWMRDNAGLLLLLLVVFNRICS